MSDLGPARRSTLLDAAWQTAYRVGFPVARIWWRLPHQQHEGTLVAVYVGQALLLVRSSYRIEWNFPGGTGRQGETPEVAARRELAEEIGLAGAFPLVALGDACGLWDGRQDQVHFFELRQPHAIWSLPGLIDTQITRDVVAGDEKAYDDIASQVPIGRPGRPEEIASAVLWLCSPSASCVMGHALTLDGGMTVV
jgi:hypothetical protein